MTSLTLTTAPKPHLSRSLLISQMALCSLSLVCLIATQSIGSGLLLLLVNLCLVASVVDTKFRRIPNNLCYATMIQGLFILVIGETWEDLRGTDLHLSSSLLSGVLSAACCFMLLFAFWTMGAVGGGDVKLVTAIGLLTGLSNAVLAILVAHLLAAVVVIGWQVVRSLRASPASEEDLTLPARIPMAGFYASGVGLVFLSHLVAL